MNKLSTLDVASFLPDKLEAPSAWIGHIPFGAWIMKETKPKIFVELGTHYGHSYFVFCKSAKESALSTKCYAIDTWQGDEHSGLYSSELFDKVSKHNNSHYKEFSSLLRMTFDRALSQFDERSIDLLHIDGLHTYEAVKHDFESWLPKLSPNAVVLFHDTNVHERDFGVHKLWQELIQKYNFNIEFQHSYGLGVLYIGNSLNQSFEWLIPESTEQKSIKQYFETLGTLQNQRIELDNMINKFESLESNMSEAMMKLHVAKTQLAEIQNSLSWKISSPLRNFLSQLRRLAKFFKIIFSKLKKSGA